MAKRPMPKGKPFPKGVSGNPGGRHKVPDDIKKSRTFNQIELERIINKLLYLDRGALQDLIKTPGTPMIELIAASILAQAAQKGDQARLEFVLQRMIGKVKDQIDLTVVKPYVINRLDGSKVELGVEQGKDTDDTD